MPKGVPKKRYTGELKQMVVETIFRTLADLCCNHFEIGRKFLLKKI